eukprot:1970518-Prymnesium_polylepis.1
MERQRLVVADPAVLGQVPLVAALAAVDLGLGAAADGVAVRVAVEAETLLLLPRADGREGGTVAVGREV